MTDLIQLSVPGVTTQTRIVNFRDLGGHRTTDGGRVRTGMLYRCATLSHATADDVAQMRLRRIRLVIDLRTEAERVDDGVAPSSMRATVHAIPLIDQLWGERAVDESPEGYLGDRYIEMFEFGAPRLVRVIETIVTHPGSATFHCMAGKDRTGVLAATILTLLGVSETSVLDDYERSADAMSSLRAMFLHRFPERAEELLRQPSVYDAAPRSAMKRALDHVSQTHGSIEEYIRSAGLTSGTLSALRNVFVEQS